jgi:hypothetical protein
METNSIKTKQIAIAKEDLLHHYIAGKEYNVKGFYDGGMFPQALIICGNKYHKFEIYVDARKFDIKDVPVTYQPNGYYH